MNNFVKLFVLIGMTFTLWGCSDLNGNAPALDAAGKHPENWIVDHRSAYKASIAASGSAASQCASCHGADLAGGIAKVSCFSSGIAGLSCHVHPADFRQGTRHGAAAKGKPGLSSGFSFCRSCHGSEYAGGTLSQVSCFSSASAKDSAFACHGSNSPHPKRPWFGGSIHTSTDQENAVSCMACHSNGANSALKPATVPPAGTPPGCFNNTLCHGVLGHPDGWRDPSRHGAAAKSVPTEQGGFAYCQTCHGQDFAGGMANLSCFTAGTATGPCHVRAGVPVGAAHAPAPWRSGLTATNHADTDQSNGKDPAVCAACHLNGANSTHKPNPQAPEGTAPDCFNNTLCHGVEGHPAGWADAAQHGSAAKANLVNCQYCHAAPSTGGPGSNPRFNVLLGRLADGNLTGCEVCHKENTAHSEAFQIPSQFGIAGALDRPWLAHNTAGNIDTACVLCHGANLEGGAGPACTDCHAAGLPTTFKDCTSCHGAPPNGTAFPNTKGAHLPHNGLIEVAGVCGTCHNGFGSGTDAHFNESRPPAQAPADVALISAYNAESGAAAYSSATGTCTNVSCHGGRTTPNWKSGAIDALNDCQACHRLATAVPTATTPVTPQYNSYYSGKHKTHVVLEGIACNVCHDMNPAAASPSQGATDHFRFLATPAMEGPARTTLKSPLRFNTNTNPPSCWPMGCHSTEKWTQDPLP